MISSFTVVFSQLLVVFSFLNLGFSLAFITAAINSTTLAKICTDVLIVFKMFDIAVIGIWHY